MYSARFCSLMLAVAAALFAAPSSAERYYSSGDYTVHYAALRTDFLTQDVARAYGVVRSTNRAFVNISVHKGTIEDGGAAVKAKVSATATNLNGQLRNLQLREIAEGGGGVYYIAEMPISNEEIIDYKVDVLPSGEKTPLSFDCLLTSSIFPGNTDSSPKTNASSCPDFAHRFVASSPIFLICLGLRCGTPSCQKSMV